MRGCPTFQALAEHASGAREDEAVRRHLSTCSGCRDQARQVRADNEFLAQVLSGAEPDLDPAAEFPGYRILDEIHRGGQGIVYRAVQLHTHRTVALKVLAEGALASQLRRRRFEREVELVSRLRHPNIVAVFDSGSTVEGRDYLVMEYVAGLHPQEYLAQQGEGPVDPRLVLELVARICDGVQHAHLHGVIHRDLKPENILVDAEGNPRILDFGMARGAGLDLTEDGAPLTLAGEFVGTLAYASPEQLKGDPELVESRTDVYSIGVILYGLLTGRSPYGKTSSVADLVHAICDVDPPPPGAVLAGLAEGRAGRSLRSYADLDAVVQKALAKRRSRRYQSAGALAEDLRCCLRGEPVAARHDSPWYLVRRSLVRHRVAVATLLAFIAVLAGSTVLSLGFWKQTASALETVGHERETARVAAARAEEMNAFLQDLFRSLSPVTTPGRAFLAREVLDRAAEDLGRRFEDHPDAEQSLRRTLAQVYGSLGMLESAARQLQRALALQEPEGERGSPAARADLLYQLGETLSHLGDWQQAEDRARQCRALVEAEPRPDARMLANLTALEASIAAGRNDDLAATRGFELAVQQVRAACGAGMELAHVLVEQASHHLEMGRLEPAEDALLEARTILTKMGREESVVQARLSHHLARCLEGLGHPEEALAAAEHGYQLTRHLLGPDHGLTRALAASRGSLRQSVGLPRDEDTRNLEDQLLDSAEDCRTEEEAYSLAVVGSLLQREGRLEDAERLMGRAAVLYEQHLGPTSLPLAVLQGNLGTVNFDQGDWPQAERHLRRAVDLVQRNAPHLSYRTLAFRCSLAWMLAYRGDAEEARRIAQGVVEEAGEGGRTGQEGVGLSVLGFALCQGGRAGESVPVLRDARTILERELGPQHQESIHCRHHLAYSLAMVGELEEARLLYRQVAGEYRRLPAPASEKAATALNGLGQALFVAGQLDEARGTFQEALETFRQVGGRSTTLRVQLLNNLGATYLALERAADAEGPLRDAVSAARAGLPALDQARLHSLMNLSRVLEVLGRPAEAVELWVEVQEQAQSVAEPPQALREQAAAEIRRLQGLGT